MNTSASTGTLMGHPKGLILLFGTEMWERMSYYGMRAIFVLYLTSATAIAAFGWEEMSETELRSNALDYLGTFAFLAYIAPVLGGWIADNHWGQRKTILVGGFLMMIGQFALGFPHHLIPGMEFTFLMVGLVLLIAGTGLFKPNISTMVGDLYEEGDHRRDAAYTIFYMGINIGALLGPLVVGGIGEKINYQYGFLAAGIGMGLGLLLQLFFANRYLGTIGNEPAAKLAKAKNKLSDSDKNLPLTPEERDRVKVILILSFFTIMFWMGFEQAAGSFNLFAKYNTDLVFFGWEMPASWLQVVNPIFIILLAPLFAAMWVNLGSKEPTSPVKFSMGLIFLGIGFLCMVGAAIEIGTDADLKASVWWLVGAYFFHTVGELCLSPIGLSMVSKLAPLKFSSLMMGLWFFFTGVGNKAAAEIGKLVGEAGPLATFGGVAIAAILAGIILFLLSNKLVDWMHGAEKSDDSGKAHKLEEELSVVGTEAGMPENHPKK